MALFMEYASDLERDVDILFRESEIELRKLETQYLLESCTPDMFTEAEEEAEKSEGFKSKAMNFVKSVVEKLRRLINDFLEMFKNISNKEMELTAEEYLKSQSGQIQLDKDYQKLDRVIQNEMAQGRKFVNMIAKGVKVEPAVVAQWVDAIPKKLNECSGKAFLTSASMIGCIHAMSKRPGEYKDTVNALGDCVKNASGNEGPVDRIAAGIKILTTTGMHAASEVMRASGIYNKNKNKYKREA